MQDVACKDFVKLIDDDSQELHNLSMRNLLLLTTFIFSQLAFSLDVQMSDTSDPVAYGRTTTSSNFSLTMTSSGDGKSKTAAYKLYVPYESSAALNQELFYYKTISGDLPDKDTTVGGLQFELDLDDDDDSDQELLVAMRKDNDDSTYIVVGSISESTPFVSMKDLCDSGGDIDCAALEASDNLVDDVYLYIFYDDGLSAGGTFNPETSPYDNGIYVYTYFSTAVEDYNTGATSITSLIGSRGDGSAYLEYSGSIDSTTYSNGSAVYEGVSDTFLDEYETGSDESGEIQVKNLTNGTTYSLGLAFKDKFGFRSNISTKVSVTPEEIEALLEEKACYFVTAGFQRDHYVLDYFRSIRDRYLLKSSFGRSIVNIYYATAPKYTSFIYENKVMSFIVRAVSYGVYGLLKYFYWVLSLTVLTFLAIRISRVWRREFS